MSKHNNNQDNISPPDPSKPATLGPENCNIVETQHKDLKITSINMTKLLKEEMIS